MTPAPDHCPLKYTGEDVAAWRAKLLDDNAARQFADHLATCTACQSHLYIFESAAHILRRQYIPDLHTRIWRDLRVQLRAAPHQGGIPMTTFRRSVLPGLVLALVFIVVVVAVGRVLSNHNHIGNSVANTPTVATSTPLATPVVPIPAMQAWGASALNTHALVNLPNGNDFLVSDSFQDGSVLVGEEMTPNQSKSNTSTPILSIYTVATGAIRHLYTFNKYGAAEKTDGRYVAWINPALDTGANSPHHQVVGYADLQTGQVTIMFNQDTYVAVPNGTLAVSNGYFVWEDSRSDFAISLTNMATGVTQTLPMHSASVPQLNWPYLLYNDNAPPNTAAISWHLYNLQTRQDVALGQVDGPLLHGTTVYWVDNLSHVQQLDHADQPRAQSHVIYTLPSTPNESFTGITDRLIIWTDTKQAYAWDRVLKKVVLLPVYIATNQFDPNLSRPVEPQIFGNIVVLTTGPDAAHTEYTIIDTTRLPTSAP